MPNKNSNFSLLKDFKKDEMSLIEKMKNSFPHSWESSIGNDCAVFSLEKNSLGLVTKDLLVENTHFYPSIPLYALAYKSLLVNLSDIFSDGGEAKAFVLGVGFPQNRQSQIPLITNAFIKAANFFKVPIIGGDTVSSDQFFISVTCLGEKTKSPWLRKKAQAGDFIYMTGSVGGSFKGLEKIRENSFEHDLKDPLVRRHLFPPYYKNLVEHLNAYYGEIIHAGVDVSDGLLPDLYQILIESQLSAVLDEDSIKVDPSYSVSEKSQAYFKGEDYELVFTSSKRLDTDLILKKTGFIVNEIGKMVDNNNCLLTLKTKNGSINFHTMDEKKTFSHILSENWLYFITGKNNEV